MTELHVPLPSTLEAAIAARVAEGGYLDAPDYIRDLLRRDLAAVGEDRRWLKAMIDEGQASGIAGELDDVIEQIIAEQDG